jgi:hypothetical protein
MPICTCEEVGTMSHMRGHPLIPVAVLGCAVIAGCAAGTAPSSAPTASPLASQQAVEESTPAGPVGSPGNPLLLGCQQETFIDPLTPLTRGPGDLVVGPLVFFGGKKMATASPTSFEDHGSVKVAVALTPGSTATVTIASQARKQVVISSPFSTVGGVTAATYRSCPTEWGFFSQSFTFTRGQTRGCVPLEVRIGRQPQVHHVTISLFAGPCAQ